ncbi:MAG: type IV pilus modification PilV family protein [Bacteroidota bacterium]
MRGTREFSQRGMSLIEVAIALGLLALIVTFLFADIQVMTMREHMRVELRSKANALATRLIEEQRAQVRASSFAFLLGDSITPIANPLTVASGTIAVDGFSYNTIVTLSAGSVQNGSFVQSLAGAPDYGGVPRRANDPATVEDESILPAFYAAARVTVTVSWTYSGQNNSISRQTIIVPL